MTGELLFVLFCIALNGLLACVEMAFVAANRPKLRQLAAQGHADAERVLELRRNPERTLSVLQIGITALSALAAAVSGAGVQEDVTPRLEIALGISHTAAEALAILILVVPLTYLTVVAGELVPKSLALRRSAAIAMRSARWLMLLDRLLAPAVWVLERSTRWTLRNVFRIRLQRKREPELGSAEVDLTRLSEPHRQYVANLMEIERKRVRDTALPWQQVHWVASDLHASDVEQIVVGSGHTRLPVLRGSEILGFLHTKDFMAFRVHGRADWAPLIRRIVRVDADTSLLAALRELQSARSHLAVVVSDGAPVGILTLEDVFEEVVGEIHDENEDGLARRLIVRRPSAR
jgi:putative hemolysin